MSKKFLRPQSLEFSISDLERIKKYCSSSSTNHKVMSLTEISTEPAGQSWTYNCLNTPTSEENPVPSDGKLHFMVW